MNLALVSNEVQEYLDKNKNTPIHNFVLSGSPFLEISIQELAQQLEGRRKAVSKLPTWYSSKNIMYPPKLNLEQTSSEKTARYKASLISGDTLLDGTGGFGIDSYFFSKTTKDVTHVEMNAELSVIAEHNFKQLGKTIKCVNTDVIECLKLNSFEFDVIYLDPARSSSSKGKVFMLEDCLPNVPANLDLLLSRCNDIWIKTAPLLDITAGLRELKNVKEIHIVALKNEVKELLWHLTSIESNGELKIKTTNINPVRNEETSFTISELENASPTFSKPKAFLYEPNAAIMKSGAFKWVSAYFELDKIHEHSHLYTSQMMSDFPGRTFKINQVFPYSKKLKSFFKSTKANVTTRNFPLSVAQIRERHKIKDGGDTYLFFTTDLDNNLIVIDSTKI